MDNPVSGMVSRVRFCLTGQLLAGYVPKESSHCKIVLQPLHGLPYAICGIPGVGLGNALAALVAPAIATESLHLQERMEQKTVSGNI